MSAKRSPEWLEGYNWQGPRSHNPYHNDLKTLAQSLEWLNGWYARFYGESP